jgi:photosystem II stability/assembly factor-like uncharacterized protein
MQEQEISDRIHAAFEVEPLAGGFDRLRIALDSSTVKSRPRLRVPSARRWAPVVAALIAVAIAASALAYALETRPSAVSNPPRAGSALLPVTAVWAYSANDVAIQLAPPDGHVVISHDGGKSWVRTPLASPQINLRWIDSRHIVASTDEVGPPFEVASSSDGGTSWRMTRIPSFQVVSMFFLNDHEGWALCVTWAPCENNGNQTILYHTVDGGTHWEPINIAVSSPVVWLLRPIFIDSEHGFISTMDGDSVARLLRTADGGKTWRFVELPGPAGAPTTGADTAVDCGWTRCALDPVFFGSRGVVTVIGRGVAPYTVTTADGGVTWGSPHTMPFSSPADMLTSWLQAQDPDNWWVVDATGSLYGTQDAGISWRRTPASLPAGYMLESVTAGGNGVLWGITRNSGSSHYSVRSTDGGRTWSLVKLPANPG